MNKKLFLFRVILTRVYFCILFFGIFLFIAWAIMLKIGGHELAFSTFGKCVFISGMFLPVFSTVVLCIVMPSAGEILEWNSEHESDADK